MVDLYVVDFDTQSFLENQCFPYIDSNSILKDSITAENMILFYSTYSMIMNNYTGYKLDIELMQSGKNYLFDELLQKSNDISDLDKHYKSSSIRCISSFLNLLFKKKWNEIGEHRISSNDLDILLEGVNKIKFEGTVTKRYRPVSTPIPLKPTQYSNIKLGYAILAIATAITSEQTGGNIDFQKNIEMVNRAFNNFLFQLDGWEMRGQQVIKGETRDVSLDQTKRTANYSDVKRNETKKMTIYLVSGDELNPRLKGVRKLAPDLTQPIDYNFIISKDNKKVQYELRHHLSSFVKVGIVPNPESRWTITYVLNTDDAEPYADSIISNTFNLINKLYSNEIKSVQDATKDIPDVLKLIDFRAAFLDNVLTISWNKLSKKGNILTRLFGKKGKENDIYKRVLLNIDISVTKQVENKKVLQEQKENIIIPTLLIENDEITQVITQPNSSKAINSSGETTAKIQMVDKEFDFLKLIDSHDDRRQKDQHMDMISKYDANLVDYSNDPKQPHELVYSATGVSNVMKYVINYIVNPILTHHNLDAIDLAKDKSLIHDVSLAVIRFKFLVEKEYLTIDHTKKFEDYIVEQYMRIKLEKAVNYLNDAPKYYKHELEFLKKYADPEEYEMALNNLVSHLDKADNTLNKHKQDPNYENLEDRDKIKLDIASRKKFLEEFTRDVLKDLNISRIDIEKILKNNKNATDALLRLDYESLKSDLPNDNMKVDYISRRNCVAFIIGAYLGSIIGQISYNTRNTTRTVKVNNPTREIKYNEIEPVIKEMLKTGNILVFKTTYFLDSNNISIYSNVIKDIQQSIERLYTDRLDYIFANLIIDMNIKMIGNAILIALPPTSRIKVLDTHNSNIEYEDSDVIVGQADQPEFNIDMKDINPAIYGGGKAEMVRTPGGFRDNEKLANTKVDKIDLEATKIPESLQLDEGRFTNLITWLKDKYNGDVEAETDIANNKSFWNSVIETILYKFNINSKNTISYMGVYPKNITANKLINIINSSYNKK